MAPKMKSHDKILSGLQLIHTKWINNVIQINMPIPSVLFFFSSFLSHGDSYRSLANRFHLSPAKVHQAVRETCKAIAEVLTPIEMLPPTTEDWIKIE